METNIKRYILAALAATVAVAAFVTVFFVVLSPARVLISVIHADSHPSSDGSVNMSLVLAANNTSRRAAVMYQSLFVDVSNNTGPEWVYWIRANVATALPLHQRSSGVANISATVSLVGGPLMMTFTGGGSFTVMVTAEVRFKVGIARTRLYDIKVACSPLSFSSRDRAAKRSNATATAALGLPVHCV